MPKAPYAESDLDTDGGQVVEFEETGNTLEDVWDRALTRFDAVAMPQQELRAQSLEARRFVTIPGAMWEGPWGYQWENAPRPEVDKITKSLEKIELDYRENRLTVDFVPADDTADEDTAEMLDGMHRADSYHFKAQQGRDNAFQEAIRGGFGAYRLLTDYADPYDPSSDAQRINPAMSIVDADQSVYFYGGILYDKSDAEAAFVITRDLRAIAEQKWGADNCVAWPLTNWKFAWDWYTPDVVATAEYYEVEDKKDKLIILSNPLTEEEQRFFQSEIEPSDIADLVAQGWEKTTRTFKRKRIHKYILNGTKVLKDCGYIAGDSIPIVPVYGRRDWVDNMERWRGHVGKKMDRQRIYNASVAKVVETQALAPYPVPILYAEQLAGSVQDGDGATISLAEHWAQGNIARTPFRIILPMYNPDGTLAVNGPIGNIEPPQVQPGTAALLQITSADLTDDDQNADEVRANVSADAMDIAAARVDAKSGIYLDNMRQSIQREAEIYLGMAREIYYEPGRKVETLTMDGKDGMSTLAEPVMDKNKVFRIRNDLTRGRYKVVADVQESTTTKRQKAVRESLQIAEVATKAGDQALSQAAILTAVMNQDGEGMQDMQAFARNRAIGIGLVKPTPEEQAQLAQEAEKQQEPSAADKALAAQADELASKALVNQSSVKVNEAKAVETLANAQLKTAQAEAVGGPVSEPETPTGLHSVEVEEKLASAELKRAQAENIRHEIPMKRARTAHEIDIQRRQQGLAEREPRGEA